MQRKIDAFQDINSLNTVYKPSGRKASGNARIITRLHISPFSLQVSFEQMYFCF